MGVREWSGSEAAVLNTLLFITSKPMLYLVNLSVDQFLQHVQGESLLWKTDLEHKVHQLGGGHILFYSVEFEQDCQLDEDFWKEYGEHSQVKNIIKQGYQLLGLNYFFTVGADEVRAWPFKAHSLAPQAAAVIHTDF